VSYEARVQAVYLLAMFTGAPTALLPEATVIGLQFQAKIHGYETDDLVCSLMDQTGSKCKALLQVKRSVKASTANTAFREAVTAAWPEGVNHFETMNLNNLVSNSLSSCRLPEPALAC
jgi:hypothetical protein